MTKTHLYLVNIKSADATAAVDAFTAEQQKITKAIKRAVQKELAKKGLSREFSYAEKKVSNLSRCFQVYATRRAADTLRKEVPGILDVRRLYTSAYALSKNI